MSLKPTWVPRLAPLLAALVLAGCASAPDLDPKLLPATPAAFREPSAATAPPQASRWQSFADPVLDDLVERAGRQNNSVQVAAARLAQARALVRTTDAARAPQVGIGAGAVRATTPGEGPAAATLISAGAALSWEADLFGRLSLASDAASLDAASRAALLQGTRLAVESQVAQTYFALRALDDERSLVQDTVRAYHETLRLIERRYAAGDVAELDLARVRSEVAATESDAIALERQRARLEHALAVLVGESATEFSVAAIDWRTALPVVPAGVPSTVLARRPDVAAAMASLRASQARLGVAQAAWLPDLVLTASGGTASLELSDVFKASTRVWGLGALLSLPVFDGGRREAGVANAQGELDGALASYREQVLVAFKDVEDELVALRLLAEQQRAQALAVEAAARATTLSATRYRNGLVSQLELLDAQRSELRNRRQALQVRSAQYQATVGLIRALGGGWDA